MKRSIHPHPVLVSLLSFVLVLPACGADENEGSAAGDSGTAEEAGPTELVLSSSTFEDGGVIPAVHRCANSPSPAFSWSGGPRETQSYAIVMRDATLGGFLHWVLYDIPASTKELAEGVPSGYEPGTPPGMKQATVLGTAYFGPCSASNTYEFTLHAVDVPVLTELVETSPGADVTAAIEAHSLATAKLGVKAGP